MPLYSPAVITHPGYASGRYYSLLPGLSTSGVAVPAVDKIYFFPFVLPNPVTITAIIARVGSAGTASAMKAAIWAHSTNGPVGAPLLVDNTGVATTSGNTSVSLTGATGSLLPGTYWAGSKHTGTLPQMIGVTSSNLSMSWIAGQATNIPFTTNAISMDDAYSGNMPTIAGNQSFTAVGSSGVPLLGIAT